MARTESVRTESSKKAKIGQMRAAVLLRTVMRPATVRILIKNARPAAGAALHGAPGEVSDDTAVGAAVEATKRALDVLKSVQIVPAAAGALQNEALNEAAAGRTGSLQTAAAAAQAALRGALREVGCAAGSEAAAADVNGRAAANGAAADRQECDVHAAVDEAGAHLRGARAAASAASADLHGGHAAAKGATADRDGAHQRSGETTGEMTR